MSHIESNAGPVKTPIARDASMHIALHAPDRRAAYSRVGAVRSGYRRLLSRWASDVLNLRASGRLQSQWCDADRNSLDLAA